MKAQLVHVQRKSSSIFMKKYLSQRDSDPQSVVSDGDAKFTIKGLIMKPACK